MVKPLGRKQINFEQQIARFPEGTLARMEAVLRPFEKRADFLREAVERELQRREMGTEEEDQTPEIAL
jgi:hypothetical protein